jgi:hypothetical protein
LIGDRDGKFRKRFDAVLADASIAIVHSDIKDAEYELDYGAVGTSSRRQILDRTGT